MDTPFTIEGKELKKYSGKETKVIIPDTVEKISSIAFKESKNIESITIPDSVIVICGEAFLNLKQLRELIIPKNVMYIGENICGGDVALEKIEVASENRRYASYGCNCVVDTKTKALIQGCSQTTIPDNVKVLENRCIWNHNKLKQIDIPNSVTEIKGEAFYGARLGKINISKNVKYISPSAFLGNFNLKTIAIDRENANYYDGDENSIIQKNGNILLLAGADGCIPEGVNEIGLVSEENVESPTCIPFYNATQVERIVVPQSVSYIYRHSFENCQRLQYLDGISENMRGRLTFHNDRNVLVTYR